MTRGRIDLKVVHDRLRIAGLDLAALRALPQESLEIFRQDPRTPRAAESHLRRAIQALFDALRHLLAKAHGFGALEYKEIARLAAKQGWIPDPELAANLVLIAGFRNRLVHLYQEVQDDEIYRIVRHHLHDLEHLAEAVREAATRLPAEG